MIRKHSIWPAGALLFGLTGVLAFTTFQWGGVVRAGRYEWLLVVGLLAVCASSTGLFFTNCSPDPGRVFHWATILLPAYVLFQVIPLPASSLRILSPARAAAVAALDPIGAGPRFAPLSVFPAGTFQYFLLVCAYLVIFLLARELAWVLRDRLWLLVWPIIGTATLEAVLGLWQYFGGNGEQNRWGTYANHNHFAGFMEMSLPFVIMYPAAVLRRSQSRLRSSVTPVLMACGIWTIAGAVLLAIVYSFSRMGFIAALLSMFVMGGLTLGTRKWNSLAASRTLQGAVIATIATLVFASFAFLPPDKLIQRFARFVSADGLTDEGRSGLWMETVPLIKAYPVFGCGLGGYETAFSRFKVSGMLVTDDYVHNDYIQLLAELGLIGFSLFALLAFSVLKSALRGATKSPDPQQRYFAVACLGSLAAISFHSFADFNLYIPANAMLLAWIGGSALAAAGERAWPARDEDGLQDLPVPEAPAAFTRV